MKEIACHERAKKEEICCVYANGRNIRKHNRIAPQVETESPSPAHTVAEGKGEETTAVSPRSLWAAVEHRRTRLYVICAAHARKALFGWFSPVLLLLLLVGRLLAFLSLFTTRDRGRTFERRRRLRAVCVVGSIRDRPRAHSKKPSRAGAFVSIELSWRSELGVLPSRYHGVCSTTCTVERA